MLIVVLLHSSPLASSYPKVSEKYASTAGSDSDGVLVPPILVVTVDGSLRALDRDTGEGLWETPLSNPTRPPSPLVSVSGDSSLIPSAQSYIYMPRKRGREPKPSSSSSPSPSPSTDGSGADVRPAVKDARATVYDTVSVSELVSRSPFVDESGRVFAGSRRGMAIGVDWRDGSVRRLVDAEGVFDVHQDGDGGEEGVKGEGEEGERERERKRAAMIPHLHTNHQPTTYLPTNTMFRYKRGLLRGLGGKD